MSNDEANTTQWVWGANDFWDVLFHDLKDYLFEEGHIDKKSKWTFTKYALMRLAFDYATEVVKGFQYTPEQLVELIDYHDSMKTKFQKLLKEIAASKKEVTQEILNGIDFPLEEDVEEDEE
jgi:hypothetical protein